MDLVPSNEHAQLLELAKQVEKATVDLGDQFDIVGFSMGALVSRVYLQLLGGVKSGRVRRFISISGPHQGTFMAYALPFAGVRDMRPGSALLEKLRKDDWGNVEVHCLYTPWDASIVPAKSSILPGATSVTKFNVPLHRFMITDGRVLDHIAQLLRR